MYILLLHTVITDLKRSKMKKRKVWNFFKPCDANSKKEDGGNNSSWWVGIFFFQAWQIRCLFKKRNPLPLYIVVGISYMNIEKDILKPDLISFTNWGGGSWTLLGGQLDCSTLMTSLIFSLFLKNRYLLTRWFTYLLTHVNQLT